MTRGTPACSFDASKVRYKKSISLENKRLDEIIEHMFYNFEMSLSPHTPDAVALKDEFVLRNRSIKSLPFGSVSLHRGDTVVIRGHEGSGLHSFFCDLLTFFETSIFWKVGVNLRDVGVKGILQGSSFASDMFFVNCSTEVAPRCVHSLLDSFDLVVLEGDFERRIATRLSAKARQRGALLVVLEREYRYRKVRQRRWLGRVDLEIIALRSGFHVDSSKGLEIVVREDSLLKIKSHGMESFGTLAKVS